MTRPAGAVERDLVRAAQAFDAPALLEVLALLGYREDEIVLRGPVGRTSRANVVEGLELLDGTEPEADRREARISTNLGLLGPQGPLPSFFLEALDTLEGRRGSALLDLLGLLDHHALALRFASLYPERDARLAGGAAWEETKRSVTRVLGLASPSTLHWLFDQVFPELEVAVHRRRADRRMQAGDFRLGRLELGGAALGGDAEVPVGGIEVVLTADAPPPARSWPIEAARRIREQIVPTLAGVELDLTVRLRLLEPPHPFRLAVDSVGDAALGAAPASPDDLTERLLLICSGAISELLFPPHLPPP